MFCPKCGQEYQEGTHECTECKVPLSENTDKAMKPFKMMRFMQCFFLSVLCFGFLLFGILVACALGVNPFHNPVLFYLLSAIFGAVILAVFLYNNWESFFVLPLAWLLNVIYIFILCDIEFLHYKKLSAWHLWGGEFLFPRTALIFISLLVLPNIIYSLLLTAIYPKVKKNEEYVFCPKLFSCKIMQCFLLSLVCLLFSVGVVFLFSVGDGFSNVSDLINTIILILLLLFGVSVFAVFWYNNWKSLFIFPLAWLLNILYAIMGLIGWFIGGHAHPLDVFFRIEWDLWFAITMIYVVVVNIVYSLLLAIIYSRIRKTKNTDMQEGNNVFQVRPWTRYFARLIDIIFFEVLLFLIIPKAIIFNEFIFGLLILFLWIFMEAILLSTWGTTPGKWWLKIKVTSSRNEKLSLKDAFNRSFIIWWRGLAAGIPLINLVTLYNSYSVLKEYQKTTWDSKGDCVVSHEKVGIARTVVLVLLGIFFVISGFSE